MDYDHIKIKISCEMKNGYVWEIRTRILFYIALCIALVFMMQHSVTWKLPGFYRASFKIHCSLAFINTIYGCFTLIYEKGGIVYSLFFPNNRFDWSKNWKPELCISSFHFWTYS